MNRKEQAAEEERSRVTVGELVDQLSAYPRDTEITFGCLMDTTFLTFYRVKRKGDKLVLIELNELRE